MTERAKIQALRDYVSQLILAQETLVERLLIALLADGHLLVEGAPGLAKTRAIKVLGEGIEGDFQMAVEDAVNCIHSGIAGKFFRIV